MENPIKLILIFLAFIQLGLSQNDLENHKKYWYYKSHFNNDFIKVGLNAGESIPFNERASNSNLNSNLLTPKLHSGDGAARLGIYLAVLATEFKLLHDNNQDVSTVKHEIFCALSAINRLDLNAEPLFEATGTQSVANLNGFFVRDDIPENFVFNNYEHFNYFSTYPGPFTVVPTPTAVSTYTADHGFSKTITHNMFETGSSLSGTKKQLHDGTTTYNKAIHGFEESQDQLYYLLMGLTLTNKLVGPTETDGSNVFANVNGETKLAQEAADIAERLINHVKNDALWEIRNPAHANTPNTSVQTGGTALVYSYPLDNLGDFIKNNESLPFVFIPFTSGLGSYPRTPTGSFRNSFSASAASPFGWQILGNGGGGISSDQQGFFHCLAGASNSVYDNLIFINLTVQAQIIQLQAQVAATQASITAITNILLTSVVGVPPSVANQMTQAANLAIAAITSLANAIKSTISVLMQFLHVSALTNVTDIKLQYNSELNPVYYFDNCLSPPSVVSGLTVQTPLVHFGSEQFFGIYLRDVLHGLNASLPGFLSFISVPSGPSHTLVKNTVEGILNDAPCEGNFNFQDGNAPTGHNWGASCFMDRPDPLWRKSTCNVSSSNAAFGEYSGLDYMLLHNLFFLTEGTNTTAIQNFIDRKPTTNFPINSTFNTTNNSKATFGAYETISATNTINATGAVIYRAGKEIALLADAGSNNGFSVLSGADFDAVIEEYTCSAINNTLNRMAPGGPQTPPDDFFIEENHQSHTSNTQIPATKNISQTATEIVTNTVVSSFADSLNKQFTKIDKLLKQYNKMNIYPNPNEGDFMLAFDLEKENAQIQIMNALGQIVFQENNISGFFKIPVSLNNYAKGLYIAKLKLSSGTEEIKKITIK